MGAARDPAKLKAVEALEDTQDVPPARKDDPQPIETTGGLLDVVTRCVHGCCALCGCGKPRAHMYDTK